MSFPRSHTALEEEHQISQKEAKKSGVSEKEAADAHPLFILRSPRRDQSVAGAEPAEPGGTAQSPQPFVSSEAGTVGSPSQAGLGPGAEPAEQTVPAAEKLFLHDCVYS